MEEKKATEVGSQYHVSTDDTNEPTDTLLPSCLSPVEQGAPVSWNLKQEPPTTEASFLWADNKSQTGGFKRVTFTDLAFMASAPHTSDDKGSLPAFLPSLAEAKTKAAVMEANAQTALVVDIDHGYWGYQEMVSMVEEWGCAYLLYSTWSYTFEHPRFRIVIPLARPVDVELWEVLQGYLVHIWQADRCCAQPQQISFAPAVAPSTTGDGYRYKVDSQFPLLCPDTSFLVGSAQEWYQAQLQVDPETVSESLEVEALRCDEPNLINEINRSRDLHALLLKYGFKRVDEGRYLPPESSSGIAGVVLFEDGNAGLCHNTSCPLYRDGARFDAFDVLLHYEYGGNMQVALKMEGLALTAENQHSHTGSDVKQESACAVNEEIVTASLGCRDELMQLAADSQLVKFAYELAKVAQYPSNSAIITGLSAFASLIAAVFCAVRIDGSRLNIGPFTLAEQPPGSGKSRILNAFIEPILRGVKSLNQRFRQTGGAVSEEDGGCSLRQLKVLATNITPEALEKEHLVPNNGFFSLASAEQGMVDVLLGLTRGGDRKNDNDLLLKGHQGEWHSASRVTRSGYEGEVHGSVTLIAQPGSIETVLSNSNGQGIAERFLMYAEPDMLGQRDFLNRPVDNSRPLADRYLRAVNKLCDMIFHAPSTGLEDLVPLRVAAEGWRAIDEYRQTIEPELKAGNSLSVGILRGAFGKADIQILKLSATLHVAQQLMLGRDVGTVIETRWVEVAIQVTDHILKNLKLTLEAKGVCGEAVENEAILRIFKSGETKSEQDVKKSRINVLPFKEMTGNRSKAVEAAIDRCVQNGELVETWREGKRYLTRPV